MAITETLSTSKNSALLRRAVHRNTALSFAGLHERAFTYAFSKMVYPQIWEDPAVDLEALALRPDSRIVTIASGGCNVLSYLTASPAEIVAVDLNATHLALLELKLVAAQHLSDFDDFSRLFRDGKGRRNIYVYDTLLRAHLSPAARAYWDGRDELGRRRISRFSRGFYRYGLLGRFIGLAHVLARMQGRDPRRLLTASSLDEQRRIFESELAPLFDRLVLKRLLNSPASLFGLGIPPAQYDELCGESGRASDVVRQRLRRLACGFELSSNYFAWQAFNRGYAPHETGPVPPYLDPRHYETLGRNAPRVRAVQMNFIEFLRNHPDSSLDRYVLLDAQDWMSESDLECLWREICRTARPDARVIFRTAAAASPLPSRVPSEVLAQWTYRHDQSGDLHARDRSAIYGGFHLYVLNSSH